ncbi:MAG: 3-hydroxyisobutyrate dehydrogenase [Solirubrobacteraceae bacterium]|jgi:3-hydroxyisobutyrate dehydrogenase|nr:3-hydroxyisobutyrate dehydrogenase [Solirubrobacteraceae bacterium]
MTHRETIAVLGAGGTMGLPMTRNLARIGFIVRAWNRSPEKAQPLAQDGVTLCETPAEAARGATAILTMLSDTGAVLDVMEGDDGVLGAAGSDDVVWLQMSTIGLEGTQRCAELAEAQGLLFVDAPVLGTKQPAEQGELVVLASGPGDLHDRMAPVFDVVGKRTLWVGDAGAGTRLKLAVNTWILSVVEGAAETLALAEGLGLDPALVLDAVAGGPLDLPYLQMKGRAMIARSFDPAFRLSLAAKDAALVQEAADDHGLDLPLVAAIRRRLDEAAEEHGDKDMSATFLASSGSRDG